MAAAIAGVPPERWTEPVGDGAGGDTTVLVDRVAEDAVLGVLAGAPAHALVSEEVGERPGPAGAPVVVVDPIDGSLNAKRGLPDFCLSIAVADGPALGDVRIGYLRHLTSGEEIVAVRGGGVTVDGTAPPVRAPAGLEVVVLEGVSPRRVTAAAATLEGVYRLRALGSLAISMAAVALGRADGMAALRPGRVVDVAAAHLVARELGAAVRDGEGRPLDAVPLGLAWRGTMVAARDEAHLERLLDAVRAVYR
ncbi:MAG: hypothetical protein MUE51_07685 [Thermoleophilia bacterium]|nr:hypothetical protein [Thermoleophilia bacterium]